MGVIFVAGVYGVGKSTLCKKLSQKLAIPEYSAGDLISVVNGEEYGSNKVVKNKIYNQAILINQVEVKMKEHPSFLLAGHFCIFDKLNNVDRLPLDIFKNLHIEKIILLETEVKTILNHLSDRDGKRYELQQIRCLIEAERLAAKIVSRANNCELFIHQMAFNQNDVDECISWLV